MQGPRAREVLLRVTDRLYCARKYWRAMGYHGRGRPVSFHATGYTGDLGYESGWRQKMRRLFGTR